MRELSKRDEFQGGCWQNATALLLLWQQHQQVSAGNYTHFSLPWGIKVVGAKARTPTYNSTGFVRKLCLELYGMWMSFWKRPTETHVHCLVEEATRFMSTKLKDSNTQHIDLKKKQTKKHKGRRLSKHSLGFFCKRMTGGQCRHGFFMEAIHWLVPASSE